MLSLAFDEKSNIWLQPFSVLINCMFPVEYVYADWIFCQTRSIARRADPESLASPSERVKDTGSQVEGFCIPQLLLRKSNIDQATATTLVIKERWTPDLDKMTENEPFVENDDNKMIPIFTAEQSKGDEMYAKLRLTSEWKDHRPRYKNVSYLHHAFLLPSSDHALAGKTAKTFDGEIREWTYCLHGPVRKLQGGGFTNYEEDDAAVFKYPDAWPTPAMEWLIRPRPSGWPSSELVQEIFESGCHLAPVGRGKRLEEPVDVFNYCRNPEATLANSSLPSATEDSCEKWAMDETEWRTSFSLAENKLRESMSPVQRHVIVLLKMIKKFYFPEVISTYYLKNLLFLECEKRGQVFWREDNSGSCLLFMLDRFQECLESRHLPHYIMPQSNLLMYKDPSRLKEAAVQVAEVRCNILSKTFNLLRKLQSLTFQSQTYLKNVGLQLEEKLAKMDDKFLSKEDRIKLSSAIRSVFVSKCKDVVASLQQISSMERDNIDMLRVINTSLYAYQSILARNFCALWFLDSSESDNRKVPEEEEFNTFVKQEVQDLSLDKAFYEVVNVFFESARKGLEPSLAIPSTRMMEKLREEQMKSAQKDVEEAKAELKEMLDWLKNNDLKLIEEKVTKKFKEMGFFPTQEEIKKAMDEELEALFQERIKINQDG